MLRSRVMLPVVALYNAWQAEGLPELHRALIAQFPDLDDDDDLSKLGALYRQGWADLERSGLARGGKVHPDLAGALRLIAQASTEYFGWFNRGDEGHTRSALVVSDGDRALRVVMTPDLQFVLEPVRPEDAAPALVAVLPEAPPGRGGVISLPADALKDKPTRGPDPYAEESGSLLVSSRSAPPAAAPAEQLRRLLQQKRLGGGQLYAAVRDRYGRRSRCRAPLTYMDLESGRYLSLQQPGQDGTPWVTVLPAEFRTVVARLQQLTQALA